MAAWGKADFDELKAFAERFQKLDGQTFDGICKACAKDLAARLLALVKPRTNARTGLLRSSFTAGAIEKRGNDYIIEVYNPLEYASYVEYGHRQQPGRYVPAIGKRLKASYVDGRKMLTISEALLRKQSQRYIEKVLEKKLKEALGG